MSWRMVGVDAQRLQFVEAVFQRERSLSSLCREYEISRPTGYLWLNRFREQGVAGLVEASRRPENMPRRSCEELEQKIVALRAEHPDWGARKLQVLLARAGLQVPSSTVHRVLRRHGLIHKLDSHPKAVGRFSREAPNQLWQMDFKSPKGWKAHLGPLSVIDDHSRYALVLEQLSSGRGEAVQQRLERVFIDCGLPDAMLMDHGQPWWNAQSAGGWTQLSVWLMRVGIRLYYSGVRHPQTQGKVERFHGSLEQARRRQGMAGKIPDQRWLDRFREEYNQVRPHEALAMQTPASHWQPSIRSYTGPADPAYPEGAELGQLNAQGALRLEGRNWQIAGALAHQRVRIVRIDTRVHIYYAQTLIRELNLLGQGSTMVEPCPRNFLYL
jgi:transposase InsO family protein